MKKIALFCMILVSTTITLCISVEKNHSFKSEMLSLVDLSALASGEYDDTIGENGEVSSLCTTSYQYLLEWQKCDIKGNKVDMLSRRVITHKCEGKGQGTCTKGTEYEFFDCMGMLIGSNDFTDLLYCK